MEGLNISLKKEQANGALIGINVSILIKVLHLLFVDDILIMSKATIAEWEKIQNILYVFCRASGLVINAQKYAFLHYGVPPKTLTVLKDYFHYSFKDLSASFIYLGYFLKPCSYKVED
jgi:hypothetical protein